MQPYSIYPICRNCYEAYLRQGGGIDRTQNGVYCHRLYAAGLPLLPLQVDASDIPCLVCEEPFTGDAFPDYDQMYLYLMTEEQFEAYFVDVMALDMS